LVPAKKSCYTDAMFATILSLHILVAILMGTVALRALYAIAQKRTEALPRFAKQLSLFLVGEAFSGSLLGLTAPEFSVAEFCINVGLYVGAFLLVEFLIFAALKKEPLLVFPHFYARTSAAVSLAAFVFVILVRTSVV